MRKFSEANTKIPNVAEINEDWEFCLNNRDSRVYSNLKNNVNRRVCWWPGQTEDGRRWSRRGKEKDVFPWPGAADTRVHLVDLYVKSDAAMLMTIWRRNRITVGGTESSDNKRATHMTQLLRWLRYTQMKEYPTETRLLANYLNERGAAVQGIWWVRQRQMGYETVNRMQLLQLAQAGAVARAAGEPPLVPGLDNAQLEQLAAILDDPTRDEEGYVIADVLYPETKKSAIIQAIHDLRETGEARIPRPYLLMDRPKTCTLALNEDLFLPPEATDIDGETSSMHWREQVTETTLRARINSMGWDRKWVEEMISTQRGRMTTGLDMSPRRSVMQSLGFGEGRLFELVHSYRRRYTDDEVPVITCTVWCPGMVAKRSSRSSPQPVGHHTDLTYDHGSYPFVLHRREMRSRIIDDSRGIGQIAGTWEDGLKAEMDSERDRNSLNTVPPSYYPIGKAPEQWGPGAQIETNSPDRYGFFRGVGWDVGSRDTRDTIRNLADRYFGRLLPGGQNQIEATYITQDLADTWMEGSAVAGTMELQLMQQYMPEELAFRIVGGEQGRGLRVSKAEIQGQFDLRITFNIQDLDTKIASEKIKLINESLAMDRNGVVDANEAISSIYELVDPQLGERLIKPAAAAYEQEVNDEANVFARIFAGIPTDIKPGQAFEARLEWLQNMLAQNGTAQRRMQEDPNFRAAVEQRLKQLKHQVTQFGQNAKIGKLGA